ncbi:hypothetical protein D1114_07210 [Cereibacter sphaeroides]|uniref:Uncharacterized protein n=1 Tax=Cereibacter sphaeroides TaxID=1063 RepID=A0AAX1UNK6_CERSP|nr:hypothetical protein [Cereibacter sphaeroides]RHZ96490.1 hypothetical protein D1114_07210 [Cereibacter sphaeroides]
MGYSHIFPPPATVTRLLLIEAGDVQIDCTGDYDTETGALTAVTINGRRLHTHEVATGLLLLCPEGAGTWSAPLDEAELAEAVRDAREYWRDGE